MSRRKRRPENLRVPDPSGPALAEAEIHLVYQQRFRRRKLQQEPGRTFRRNDGECGPCNGRNPKSGDRLSEKRSCLYRESGSFQLQRTVPNVRNIKRAGIENRPGML